MGRFAHDGTIPDPLDDPLRVIRKFYGWLTVINLAFTAFAIPALLVGLPDGVEAALLPVVIGTLVSLPLFFAFWRVLPNRAVNAIYLRSFSHDRETGAIRTALQAALGREFRLSGIRDPRRRWPKFLRYLAVFAFAFRYSTPKYMSLEAGNDWKSRLWASLGDARCAVIDVTDLTPFVAEEMLLCYKCLGLSRILFVGDTSKSADEWKELINRELGWAFQSQNIRLTIWDGSRGGRKTFAGEVRRFARQVPADPVGFRARGAELAEDESLDTEPRGRSSAVWVEVVVGFLLASAIVTALQTVLPTLIRRDGPLGKTLFLVLLPFAAGYLITAYHFLVYLIECGSNRERVLASVSTGVAVGIIGFAIWGMFGAVGEVRKAAERMISGNNLKQIGLAFHNYADAGDGRLPGANAPALKGPRTRQPVLVDGLLVPPGLQHEAPDDKPGSPRPPVSWRVLLLPYLEQEPLYREYRQDEPWDSPHNVKLLDRMPKVYRHPAAKDTPPGYTHYRVFVSSPIAWPQAAFTDGRDGVSLRSLRKTEGPVNTILVVEANEAVPWTKPDELAYDRKQPLPKLGGHFRGGYNVLLDDGSVKFIPDRTPEAELRAWIARGGEEIPKAR